MVVPTVAAAGAVEAQAAKAVGGWAKTLWSATWKVYAAVAKQLAVVANDGKKARITIANVTGETVAQGSKLAAQIAKYDKLVQKHSDLQKDHIALEKKVEGLQEDLLKHKDALVSLQQQADTIGNGVSEDVVLPEEPEDDGEQGGGGSKRGLEENEQDEEGTGPKRQCHMPGLPSTREMRSSCSNNRR